VFFVLLWGASGITHLSNILVAHVFVGLWMLYLLVSRRWPDLIAAHLRSRSRTLSGTTPPA